MPAQASLRSLRKLDCVAEPCRRLMVLRKAEERLNNE